MLRNIHLHGRLGEKYGRTHELDVQSPLEAVRALMAIHPGFTEDFNVGAYRITRGQQPQPLSRLQLRLGKERDVHIIPTPALSGFDPFTILIAAVVVVAAATLAVSLIPVVKPPSAADRADQKASYIFDGAVNSTEQGGPVPLIFGRWRVGSVVVSSSLEYADIPYDALTATNGGGTGGVTPGFTNSPDGDDLIALVTGIHLSKGSKGGGSPRAAHEDPNTLQSQATAKIVDLLGEGEIGGLVNGLKSVYFDDTPVQNADDSFNFKGVALEERVGLPTQDYLPGHDSQSTLREINADVTVAIGPITETISSEVDRAIVTLEWPSMYEQNTTNGDMLKSSVDIKIELQSNGGGFSTVVTETVGGKTTSTYPRNYTIVLPPGGAPYDIRVTRVSTDPASASVQNAFKWSLLQEVTDAKLTYPDSAVIGLIVDAKQFGNKIPVRAYDVYGLICEVPTNYDPVAGTYATTGPGTSGGAWDGTFKRAWTDEGVWCWRELCLNKRWGLGRRLGINNVDKWGLYQIAQRNAGLVDDGFGGTERRHTLNAYFRDYAAAYDMLAQMAASFRASVYVSTGMVMLAQDAPADPSILVTPSNTGSGEISYETTDIDELASALIVAWNDPDDGHRLAYEVVEDTALRQRIGWKTKQVAAIGETRRGGATRFGRWLLEDQAASERASWIAGQDQGRVTPNQIAAITEPQIAGAQLGGRIIAGSTTTSIKLDRPVTLASGHTYTLMCMLRDGTVEEKAISTGAGTVSTLTTSAFSTAPLAGAVWVLKGDNVEPTQWRVRQRQENNGGRDYTITAIQHDPDKYDRVELGLKLEARPTSTLPSGGLEIPSGLSWKEFVKIVGGAGVPAVQLSWMPVNDLRVTGFQVQAQRPGQTDWEPVAWQGGLSVEISNVFAGSHSFRVRSTDNLGRVSAWAQFTDDVTGAAAPSNVGSLSKVKDSQAATSYLTWTKPSDVRQLVYDIYYNSVNTFGSATPLGTVSTLRFPVASVGYYWVVARFNEASATSPTSIQIQASDLPDIDISGYLTNQAHTVATASDGGGASFTGAGGTFKVYDGLTDVTTGAGTVYSVQSSSGVTIGINSSTGVYSITAMSADQATATLRAVYGSVTIDLVYTIVKSRAGATGGGGANTAPVFLYQRAASTPSVPGSTLTYTFATGVLSGTLGSWTQSVPSGSNPLYVITAVATATGTSDTIATGDWSSPVIMAQNGADGSNGSNGANTAPVLLYQRATSAPSVPGSTLTYTFATGVLSGTLGSWSQSVPSGTNPVYVITAVATSTGTTDTIATGEWSSPIVLAQNGSDAALLTLNADKFAFTFDPDGTANPSSQTITLTATLQNVSGTISWSSSPSVTLTGSGSTRTIDLAAFGTNEVVTITATLGSVSDTLSLVRLRAGGNLFTLTKSSNISLTSRTLKKESGSNAWDSQAYSNESYVGGAFATAQGGETNKAKMFGLNSDPTTDASYTSLDYAFYLKSDGTVEIYESGVQILHDGTTYTTADVFSIVYDNFSVKYYKNGAVMRTANVTSGQQLYFDSSINTVAGSLTNVAFGPSGSGAAKQVTAYIRQPGPPSTPSGNSPSGWTKGSIPSGSDALWSSVGTFSPADVLIGAWSAPALLTNPNPRGAYSSGTTYYLYDQVTYNGGTYQLKVSSTSGHAPSGDANDNSYWSVVAAPGADGEPGTPPSSFSATIDLTTSTTGANLRTIANANGYTGASDATVTFRVPSGVTITGGIDTGVWPTGTYSISLTIAVLAGGKVYGQGGTGGRGADYTAGVGGSAGTAGGDAIYCRLPCTITNASTGEIKGGGGGGGGGGGWIVGNGEGDFSTLLAGGDGGGGFPNGTSVGGSAGTTSGGGAGESGATSGGHSSGAGGNGGGAAAAGSSGGSATGTETTTPIQRNFYGGATSGGAAGYAIRKNGFTVSVTNSGTITGTQG